MQELECVREKLQNKYRVVKTDEDLEWNRAIDLCTNIINAHLSRENDPEIARSSRDNDGWIPVEERLPDESLNSVIGWDEYRERCCFVQYYGGRWMLRADREPIKITHWRPLPVRQGRSKE